MGTRADSHQEAPAPPRKVIFTRFADEVSPPPSSRLGFSESSSSNGRHRERVSRLQTVDSVVESAYDSLEGVTGMARFLYGQSFGTNSETGSQSGLQREETTAFAKRVPDLMYIFPDPSEGDVRSIHTGSVSRRAAAHLTNRQAQYSSYLARRAFWDGDVMGSLNFKYGNNEITLRELKRRLWHPRLEKSMDAPALSNRSTSLRASSSTHNEDVPLSFQDALKTTIDMFMRVLHHSGFVTFPIRFGDGLLAIAVEWRQRELMLDFAESMYYPVPLDASKIGVELGDDRGLHAYVPYRKNLTPYLVSHNEEAPHDNAESVLMSKDRAQLARSFIAEQFSMQTWQHMGLLVDYYCPHNKYNLVNLQKDISWDLKDLLTWNLIPIDKIELYFGTRMAMYFAFVEHMVRFAFFYVGLQVVCRVSSFILEKQGVIPFDRDKVDVIQIVDCIVLCFAGKVFTKIWIRHSEKLLLHFGVNQVQPVIEPTINPKLVGQIGRFECDLKVFVVVPSPFWQKIGKCCAYLCDLLYMSLVWGMMHFHFFYYRPWIHNGSEIHAFMDLTLIVQVRLTKWMWQVLSPYITNLEQCKFLHDYDEAVELRQFCVIFLNALLPFVYASYLVPISPDQACPGQAVNRTFVEHPLYHWSSISVGCWDQIDDVCFSLMLAEMGLIFVDILRPVMRAVQKGWRPNGHLSFLEHQYLLPDYDGMVESADYQELIVPFWYVLLFSQASGLRSAVLLLFISVVQRLVDIWKVLHLYRRPMPQLIRRIGERRLILLKFISNVSAITNWSLLCLYCPPFIDWDWHQKIIMFVTGSWCITVAMRLFDFWWKDVPQRVELQSRQARYQRHLGMDKDKVQAKQVRFIDTTIGHGTSPGYQNVLKAGTLPEDSEYFENNLLEEELKIVGYSLSLSNVSRHIKMSRSSIYEEEEDDDSREPNFLRDMWSWTVGLTKGAVHHPFVDTAAAAARGARGTARKWRDAVTPDRPCPSSSRPACPIETSACVTEGSGSQTTNTSGSGFHHQQSALDHIEEAVIETMVNSRVPGRSSYLSPMSNSWSITSWSASVGTEGFLGSLKRPGTPTAAGKQPLLRLDPDPKSKGASCSILHRVAGALKSVREALRGATGAFSGCSSNSTLPPSQ